MELNLLRWSIAIDNRETLSRKINTCQCCSTIFSARYPWSLLPESGGVLQTSIAVRQLIRLWTEPFCELAVFKPFSLKLLSSQFAAVWETPDCFACRCPVAPVCVPTEPSWEQGMHRGKRFTALCGERKVPKTVTFLKGSEEFPLEDAGCCLFSHLRALPSMVCHTYAEWP